LAEKAQMSSKAARGLHEKGRKTNKLVQTLLRSKNQGSFHTLSSRDTAVNVPQALPPPNGFKLSSEEEKLFRYFCVAKPALWISTRQFNRDVPWCIVLRSITPSNF
jgi:hypothetical protein